MKQSHARGLLIALFFPLVMNTSQNQPTLDAPLDDPKVLLPCPGKEAEDEQYTHLWKSLDVNKLPERAPIHPRKLRLRRDLMAVKLESEVYAYGLFKPTLPGIDTKVKKQLHTQKGKQWQERKKFYGKHLRIKLEEAQEIQYAQASQCLQYKQEEEAWEREQAAIEEQKMRFLEQQNLEAQQKDVCTNINLNDSLVLQRNSVPLQNTNSLDMVTPLQTVQPEHPLAQEISDDDVEALFDAALQKHAAQHDPVRQFLQPNQEVQQQHARISMEDGLGQIPPQQMGQVHAEAPQDASLHSETARMQALEALKQLLVKKQ